MNFEYKTHKDYLETGDRDSVHTSLRQDLYTEMLKLLAPSREPLSKALDILIIDLLNDDNKIKEFKIKMKNYRLKKSK